MNNECAEMNNGGAEIYNECTEMNNGGAEMNNGDTEMNNGYAEKPSWLGRKVNRKNCKVRNKVKGTRGCMAHHYIKSINH